MRKTILMAAAALLLGMAAGRAAPAAKDPMCAIGGQANNPSWAEHYKCWARPAPAKAVAQRPGKSKDPMCGVGVQANNQSWAEHYHCWR